MITQSTGGLTNFSTELLKVTFDYIDRYLTEIHLDRYYANIPVQRAIPLRHRNNLYKIESLNCARDRGIHLAARLKIVTFF